MEPPESPVTRTSSASSSPEFEFWMVRNQSKPSPGLLTADELFIDGIILPLDFLSFPRSDPSVDTSQDPPPSPQPASVLSSTVASGSRRWKDLFKVSGERKVEEKDNYKEKERKKELRSNGGSSPELIINLNIWPFSRSRSAGYAGCRFRSASSTGGRKTSSAPCSRSSSRGESSKPPTAAPSACRKWASSPGRGGVHLGRTSPVWQFQRSGRRPNNKARMTALPASHAAALGGVRVLNLNMNSCIGFRRWNQVSYKEDSNDGVTGGGCTVEANPSNGSIFRLRALFSKKVY